jgi:PAS domain S-box-containing protein
MEEKDKIIAEFEEKIRRLEHELYEANERLQKSTRMQDEMVFPWAGNLGRWSMNVKTHEVICNPLKVKALGYTMEELEPVFESFTELIHPQDYEKTMDAMRRHLRKEAPAYETEYRIRTKTDEYKWFYDRGITTEFDEEEKPLWVTGIVFDITEQKAKEQELRRLLDEKDKFFSILAHDLKNPFGGFLGLTEVLSEEFDDFSSDELREYNQELHKSAGQLYKLLENLLDWGRLERGAMEYCPTHFPLITLVMESVDVCETAAAQKEIEIRTQISPETTVRADQNMVRTILRNLLNNAVKFTERGGRIELSAAERSEKEVLVNVRDNGGGMDEETQKSLFSLSNSSKASKSGTAKERGTGLGLIVCKEMVELHGGNLSVESEEGKGSSFSFTLEKG